MPIQYWIKPDKHTTAEAGSYPLPNSIFFKLTAGLVDDTIGGVPLHEGV